MHIPKLWLVLFYYKASNASTVTLINQSVDIDVPVYLKLKNLDQIQIRKMGEEVVLLGLWLSSFTTRVKIALAEKGIQYESKEEENLVDKSSLLLEMNPVHKKIPVLIHNGKPICESLLIVQYVDEVWNHHNAPPLLPSDPYQRSQARLWADYVDKKVYGTGRRVWEGRSGEDKEAAIKELIQVLKTLEGELGEKRYFGGESFGFVDVALVPFTSWFYTYEKCGNFSIEAECPKLVEWARRCIMEKDSVSLCVADPHKIYDRVLDHNRKLGIE